VCDRHYPIGGKSDPALAAAALLAPHGRYTEALEFLARSVELRGPQAQVSYNAALCHLRLGDLPAALAAADEALSFAEPSAAASQLRAAVVEEMEAAARA
jgi:tetratricopeptide (TPR) repeat protein